MKSIVLSFDDGCIYDRPFIDILDRYGIRASFNLNSGLEDFVWYYEGRPVERLRLKECVELYKNHEVASHTMTHPYLTELGRDHLLWEVNGDVDNLSRIFSREIVSFAVPFDRQNEEIISAIREHTPIRYMRISRFSDSFHPTDSYHICLNSWYDSEDIYEKLRAFINSPEDRGMFVIVGHSYEFEMENKWDVIEKLVSYLAGLENVAVEPMCDACRRYFGT